MLLPILPDLLKEELALPPILLSLLIIVVLLHLTLKEAAVLIRDTVAFLLHSRHILPLLLLILTRIPSLIHNTILTRFGGRLIFLAVAVGDECAELLVDIIDLVVELLGLLVKSGYFQAHALVMLLLGARR